MAVKTFRHSPQAATPCPRDAKTYPTGVLPLAPRFRYRNLQPFDFLPYPQPLPFLLYHLSSRHSLTLRFLREHQFCSKTFIDVNCVVAKLFENSGLFLPPAQSIRRESGAPQSITRLEMAEPEVRISAGAPEGSGDVEMQGGDDAVEVGETGAGDAPGEDMEDETAMETEKPAARVTFVE